MAEEVKTAEAEGEERYTEIFWVDFIFYGDMDGFFKEVAENLEAALKEFSSLFIEIEGELRKSSGRGENIQLKDGALYHGNLTLEFQYSSDRCLTGLFRNVILPFLFERYLNPVLNSGNCAILKDMHSGEYFESMAKAWEEQNKTIIADLPDIPPDFVKTILSAQPFDGV